MGSEPCDWNVHEICSEPNVWLSAHLHAHIRHSGNCTFTCTWCVHVNVQWSDSLMCSCSWAVSPLTDVCMKMCNEPIFLLSAHLHAHVRHTGHCTFTCTWCVLVNVKWTDCLMCSCNWAVGTMSNVCMKMCSEPIGWLSAHLHAHGSLHVYMHMMCACKRALIRLSDVFM